MWWLKLLSNWEVDSESPFSCSVISIGIWSLQHCSYGFWNSIFFHFIWQYIFILMIQFIYFPGGDPGISNQKIPTTLLLTPKEEFHSFGFAARDFFHDLEPQEAKKWLYFDKFKMVLHNNEVFINASKITKSALWRQYNWTLLDFNVWVHLVL